MWRVFEAGFDPKTLTPHSNDADAHGHQKVYAWLTLQHVLQHSSRARSILAEHATPSPQPRKAWLAFENYIETRNKQTAGPSQTLARLGKLTLPEENKVAVPLGSYLAHVDSIISTLEKQKGAMTDEEKIDQMHALLIPHATMNKVLYESRVACAGKDPTYSVYKDYLFHKANAVDNAKGLSSDTFTFTDSTSLT